jgi:hypothetical protein
LIGLEQNIGFETGMKLQPIKMGIKQKKATGLPAALMAYL